jgi:hypothetical protein
LGGKLENTENFKGCHSFIIYIYEYIKWCYDTYLINFKL